MHGEAGPCRRVDGISSGGATAEQRLIPSPEDLNRKSGKYKRPAALQGGGGGDVRRPPYTFCMPLTRLNRSSQYQHMPAQHSSVNESAVPRWKRLPPDWYDWSEPNAVFMFLHRSRVPSHTEAAVRGRVRPPLAPLQQCMTNPLYGTSGVGQRLMQWQPLVQWGHCTSRCPARGPVFQSAAASTLPVLKTWQHFHEDAFCHERPPLPLLPITSGSCY